jgi:hypothetical protein
MLNRNGLLVSILKSFAHVLFAGFNELFESSDQPRPALSVAIKVVRIGARPLCASPLKRRGISV